VVVVALSEAVDEMEWPATNPESLSIASTLDRLRHSNELSVSVLSMAFFFFLAYSCHCRIVLSADNKYSRENAMPNFVRDLTLSNLDINNDALKELHTAFAQRISVLNQSTDVLDNQLVAIYIVRFDNRGYRTFSQDEAWQFYTAAIKVERVVLLAECPVGVQSNNRFGSQIEIRLDCDRNDNSHLIVGGDSRDWVESTFAALENVLMRRRSFATRVVRSKWMVLFVQLAGVAFGVLLCLWLATVSAPYLKNVEFPRALAFAFWFLIYSNLWTYLQQLTQNALGRLFPNIRLNRDGEHWTKLTFVKVIEIGGVALFLWGFGLLANWAVSVVAPYIGAN
jgi:hypothetical protein